MGRNTRIEYKHRKRCTACMNISKSSEAFGTLFHERSGGLIYLCFQDVIRLCRTPKHAETDGEPYKTADSWRIITFVTNDGKRRSRYIPNRMEEFELKSSGWRRSDSKWEYFGGDDVHVNWQMVTGTHGRLPGNPSTHRDIKVGDRDLIDKPLKRKGRKTFVKRSR